MSADEVIHGLSCPRCGGMVPIPEGQVIVCCPFCEMRSVVKGEHGILRYQAPLRFDQNAAMEAFHKFLGKVAIARDCARTAQVAEVFLVHIPFWATWGRTAGWVFGQKEVGSGDHKHYEPREVQVLEEMSWNAAACDVGEFGVNQITLEGRALAPFDPNALHNSGMVFEPVGAPEEALAEATKDFEQRVHRKANLDRESQTFVRIINPRLGLVYNPLWVVRYSYRGRSFQVVVDGFSGEVLYGKAPGNSWYRAAVLVGGMAAGAILSVDVGGGILYSMGNSSNSDHGAGFGIAVFVVGLIVMYAAYRKFRYGEHYEFRKGGNKISLPYVGQAEKVMQIMKYIN